MRTVYVECWT